MAGEFSGVDYKKSTLPQNAKDWKKWKEEHKAQKRKWNEDKLIKKLEYEKRRKLQEAEVKKDEEEEGKKKKDLKGCQYTVAIAIPGSILDNAQSPELRTYLAGQAGFPMENRTTDGTFAGVGKKGNANVQMGRILQYLECPQYLRKVFFPQHKDLQYAGLLNPLDCPHHMKADEETLYREGVVLDKPPKGGDGSFVNIGLYREVQIDKRLKPGIRVTVQLKPGYLEKIENKKKVRGVVVSPSVPYTKSDIYWGYNVRLAASLSKVFTESPHPEGYDLLVGTSERGESVDEFVPGKFRHMLIVFGGVKGLEYSLDADQDLHIDDPSLLFNHYLNTCPQQGSRTIRTEEAILVTLSAIRPKITERCNDEQLT
ncbi:hypothetical protein LSH36_194g04061 [Paralvinella palmiformis]|uniref:28S rRNA (uridine-N(3))-methyltransferase n=1 Tax=Paralvinella palmiformis TaxID=53620 RepID=A0AAD9N4Z3_9ANNE|nr:hypothetical protein LSH36_194g04061 [Paralvinella palmiformis]